jgi:ferredoxin
MAYVITEPCIDVKDASCLDVCPVDCIYSTDADNMYFIHPDECIDCGACESVCPVSAIFPEDAVPDKWKNYVEINKVYFNKEVSATSSSSGGPAGSPRCLSAGHLFLIACSRVHVRHCFEGRRGTSPPRERYGRIRATAYSWP